MRVVKTLDELLRLPTDRHVNGFHHRVHLMLEIPEVSRPMVLRAQESLNRLQERRGGLAGSAILTATLILGLSSVLYDNESLLSWRAVGQFAVVLVASFALGEAAKWAALAFTRWQFGYRCRVHYRLLSMLLPR
jgi:hypothetical protein